MMNPQFFLSLSLGNTLKNSQGAKEILIANFNPEWRKSEKSLKNRDLKPNQNKYIP